MIKVLYLLLLLYRRGITLLFPNMIDSCARNIAHYSITYKNVYLTDSLQPSDCNEAKK